LRSPLQRPYYRRKRNTVTIAAVTVNTMVVTATIMAVTEVVVEGAVVACLSARCWVLSRVRLSWGPPRRRLRLWCIRHRRLRRHRAWLITRIVILPVTELATLAPSTIADGTLAGSKTTTRPD